MRGFISQNLDFISLVDVFIFIPVPYHFDYHSFGVSFEIKKYNASSFVLLSKDSFSYSGSLVVSQEFQDGFNFFCEKHQCNFDRNFKEPIDLFGQYCTSHVSYVQQPCIANGYHNRPLGQRTFCHYRNFYQTSPCQMHRWKCISYLP